MTDKLAEARRLLRQATYGFLVSATPTGPVARLTEHLAVDDDLAVWVGVSLRSRKVAQVRADPAVTYAVEDRDALGYASLSGRAEVVRSPEDRRRLWRPHLERFFAGGPDGDDFALLRIDPARVELMSFGAGIHPEPLGLAAVALERVDGAWVDAGATAAPA